MKVELAGMNIDIELVKEIERQDLATPETISAAYARISRSQKDVTSLRLDALNEVEKARQSNSNIIYDMGHSSIAEHAVFNFDLIGISRLMSELIHRSRLASFTEKSQRYVTLKGDYHIPEEIKNNDKLCDEFNKMISKQNDLYQFLYQKAVEYLEQTGFEGKKRELEGKAKEDARYVLSLSTITQMGITVNGRSLEKMLQRLDKSTLIEAKMLRQEIEQQVKPIAPSLIKYTKADTFGAAVTDIPKIYDKQTIRAKLIDISIDPERKILIAHLMDESGYSFSQAKSIVTQMDEQQISESYRKIFKGLKGYHSLPRSFEMCDLSFDLSMSSSCFAQLKRHRMASIFKTNYHPGMAYSIPPLLQKLNVEKEITEVMEISANLYEKFETLKFGLGAYCMTNAHHLNVLMKCNLRELYHFVRLRSDNHSQWEIKQISDEIMEIVKGYLPNATTAMSGKDGYNQF